MWILPENAVARSTPSRLQAGDPEVIYFQRYTAPASHDFSHQHCKTLHSQADNGYLQRAERRDQIEGVALADRNVPPPESCTGEKAAG